MTVVEIKWNPKNFNPKEESKREKGKRKQTENNRKMIHLSLTTKIITLNDLCKQSKLSN